MDLAAAAGKTPESDPDSSTRIHSPKPVSFSNGVLKRNHHSGLQNNNNNHHHGVGVGGGGEGGVVVYKECLKNHAASLGAHAVDGCGEFMPSPTANSADPTSLKCAACGCHRNFHRREPEDSFHHTTTTTTNTPSLEYQPHHRHHPPPPPPPPPPRDGGGTGSHSSPSSPSPPPISSSYYPSAPHLLLTLSGGGGGIPAAVVAGTSSHSPVDHHHQHQHHLTPIGNRASPVTNGRKRFRTRFTQDQKGKMQGFAEKLEWKMQKRDEELIIRFCNEIGVEKGVFKVWMHNNKNIFGKPGQHSTSNNNPIPTAAGAGENLNMPFVHHHHHQQQQNQEIQNEEEESGNHFNGDNNFNGRVVCPNGSSSSS